MGLISWLDSTPIGNVVLLWGLLLLVNVPAPWLGIRFDDEPAQVWYQPPGWVIGAAWFALFALLGLARWQMVSRGSSCPSPSGRPTPRCWSSA